MESGGDFGRRRFADRAQIIVWKLGNLTLPTALLIFFPALPGSPKTCSACC